jgi:hypothetical protein
MSDFQQNYIKIVIEIYGLELGGYQIDTLLVTWFQKYDSTWILKAIVESLYRGRYKIVSVDNILKDWHRLGKPRYNFTPEYEWEIIQNIPEPTPQQIAQSSPIASVDRSSDVTVAGEPDDERDRIDGKPFELDSSADRDTDTKPSSSNCKNLNPEESAPFQRHHSIAIARPIDSAARLDVALIRQSVANANSIEENCHTYPPLPIDFGTFQKIVYSGDLHSKSESRNIISQLPNRKLFNTLRAIVDPNNQRAAIETESVAFRSLAGGNNALAHIAHFRVSIESISGELHS